MHEARVSRAFYFQRCRNGYAASPVRRTCHDHHLGGRDQPAPDGRNPGDAEIHRIDLAPEPGKDRSAYGRLR
ncbi:hypothetical protein DIE11_27485 [Burkholderia sp. Bp9012]|nr:hypothetical protein DIE11_27485 [Burkholderia sp. Bp9012]